ncbi:MAG: hypothetical protein K6F97_05300, partial [Lachnospiraceae bacterium]|nr:hypothetical protein [Lachnospiraceae bacterium]
MPNKGNLTVDLGNKELKLNNNNMLEKVCISMVDPTTGKTVKGYFIPEIKAKENKAVGQALDYLENKYPNMKDVISKVREGVDKPDNQQENKSGNKPANKPANQQVNQPVNQSADQPVNQNVNATESTQETSSVLYTEDEDTKSEEKNATATNVQGQNNSGAGTETEVDIDAIDSFWSSSWKKLLLFFGIGEKTV